MRMTSFLVVLAFTPPATAEDYLIVFGADSVPYKAIKAHSFAAVVTVEAMPGGTPRIVELQSLSWLPAAGRVRALAIQPEVGRNVPLGETLRDYLATGCRICVWGPYLVRPELAQMFRCRVATVESSFEYKAACLLSRRGVCDCARSIEELVGERRYIGVFGYGAAAASVIVQKYSPWLIEPEHSHHWVGSLLGLDEYPLVYRPFGDYTSRLDQLKASIRKR